MVRRRTTLLGSHESALIDLKTTLHAMASGAVRKPGRARGCGGPSGLLSAILRRAARTAKRVLGYLLERP
jgi:hypothetical protein